MTATWPAGLPQKLLMAGFEETLGDGRLRSQTDTGPGKMRLRSSAMPRALSGGLLLSAADLDVLLAFVTDDLAGGTLPFTMPDQRGSGSDWVVRFAESGLPSWSPAGADLYRVGFGLEVLP